MESYRVLEVNKTDTKTEVTDHNYLLPEPGGRVANVDLGREPTQPGSIRKLVDYGRSKLKKQRNSLAQANLFAASRLGATLPADADMTPVTKSILYYA